MTDSIKLSYKEEGLRRMKIRKKNRLKKYINKCEEKANSTGCPVCGEDPYCYCGDGTPYSY